MTSRERILASLNHQQPDRMSIDFGGHRSSGIMAIAYNKLKRHLGIETSDIYVYDMMQQLAVIEPELVDYFGVDTVELGRAFMTDEADWKEWVLPDGTPCKIPKYMNLEKRGDDWLLLNKSGKPIFIQKKGSLYFEQMFYPYLDCNPHKQDFSDLEEALAHLSGLPTPGDHIPQDKNGLSFLASQAKTFRQSTDRAIIGLFGGNMFELGQVLYRMDNFLLNQMMYLDAMHLFLGKVSELHLANLEKWLSAVGSYIDVVLFGDDFGGQTGPLISLDMYREFYKPLQKKLWTRAKELTGAKVLLHSCGGIEVFLEDFIDNGLDAVNPVQISSAGMDARLLKKKYGGRFTLWGGGCDTQSVLPGATPEQVKVHVLQQLDILAPGGDFVFQQVHNIMANVPPENIVAMFEAVREWSNR